jgi:integrase
LTTARHEIKQGIHTPVSTSRTVAEAGELWIAQAEIDGLETSTVRQYRQHLDYYIKPLIGTASLAELTAVSVQRFRNALLRDGRPQIAVERRRSPTPGARVAVSPAMEKKVLISLGALLACAMANGLVARNVVREQSRNHCNRQRRLEKRHEKEIQIGVDCRLRMRSGPCWRTPQVAGNR